MPEAWIEIFSRTSFLLLDWIAADLGSYAQSSNSSNFDSQTAAEEAQPETKLGQTKLAQASAADSPQVPAHS